MASAAIEQQDASPQAYNRGSGMKTLRLAEAGRLG